jgi:hypothetical protein
MVSRLNPGPPPSRANKRDVINHANLPFLVYHQNIRGLFNKANELLDSIILRLPHVICITEHHCKEQEIVSLPIMNYSLAANFCRTKIKQGGTCIFVHESLAFSTIELKQFCLEQVIEVCAISITSPGIKKLTILCIYRSPTGNFTHFINSLRLGYT